MVRYPIRTSTKKFCDTVAASIARYEKYRYWASNYHEIVNYYAVVFLLHPPTPYLLRCEPVFEGKNVCKTQENRVSAGGVAVANRCAVVNLLRIVNSVRRSILSTAGSFGQGSVNGGFQTVVRVFWGNEIPLPPFYLNLTSFLPQFYLVLTSFLPFFNLNLTSASSRISSHGLETTVYRRLVWVLLILTFEGVRPGVLKRPSQA